MIYVMSDIHGHYEKYLAMLEKIHFSKNDDLYILGDMLDRGPKPMELILDIAGRENVFALRGNHDEAGAIVLQNYVLPVQNGEPARPKDDVFRLWLEDGGQTTYDGFLSLSSEEQKVVLDYLASLPVFQLLEVGGVKHMLSHTLPDRNTFLHGLSLSDLVLGEPDYAKVYLKDSYFVTGHTPTWLIDASYADHIWQKNNHIALDCGCGFGHPLGCLCLDTREEYYVE